MINKCKHLVIDKMQSMMYYLNNFNVRFGPSKYK